MSPTLALSPAIMIAALLTIGAEYRGPRAVVYACKPLATTLTLALALLRGREGVGEYALLIALGLVCSLAGDIFLMLPRDRFVAGLVSFLLAHLAYGAAFARAADRPWGAAALPTLLPVLAWGLAVFALLRPHLGAMTVPVLLYMLVILLMAWRAVEYARGAPVLGPRAAFGALLFVLSDSLLAVNRFARPFRAAQALVLGSYFAAQWLIALSI